MSFNQIDLNGLLSFHEKELRSGDSRISGLRSERSLEHLYCARYNQLDFCDTDCNEKKFTNQNQNGWYKNNPLLQLEDLIVTQHKAQLKLKEQIKLILEKNQLVCKEVEVENLAHDYDVGSNIKVAIKLIQEREKLNLELQNIRLKRERLEVKSKYIEGTENIKKQGNVINKLVKRRKEIQEELGSDCQKCVQLENMLNEMRKKVAALRSKLHLTVDEVSIAIKNISEPFHEQVKVTTNEFDVLRSKISDITSFNEKIKLKVRHIKENNVSFKERNQLRNSKNINCVENPSNFGKCFEVSDNISSSLLDTFDTTIKMLEKEIEQSNLLKNLNNHFMDSPSQLYNSAPHTTPTKSSTIRANPKISQKISNFECLMNSSNTSKLSDQPKSCYISSINPAEISPMNLIPLNSAPGPSLTSVNSSHMNATKIPHPMNSFNFLSKDSPLAPPPSLSASPVGKKSPLSPVGRSKQIPPPPPPPAKPGLRSPQGKSLTLVKHLIMPSKTS